VAITMLCAYLCAWNNTSRAMHICSCIHCIRGITWNKRITGMQAANERGRANMNARMKTSVQRIEWNSLSERLPFRHGNVHLIVCAFAFTVSSLKEHNACTAIQRKKSFVVVHKIKCRLTIPRGPCIDECVLIVRKRIEDIRGSLFHDLTITISLSTLVDF